MYLHILHDYEIENVTNKNLKLFAFKILKAKNFCGNFSVTSKRSIPA
jgi:hypothetical protein